jgi:hypothetical protein
MLTPTAPTPPYSTPRREADELKLLAHRLPHHVVDHWAELTSVKTHPRAAFTFRLDAVLWQLYWRGAHWELRVTAWGEAKHRLETVREYFDIPFECEPVFTETHGGVMATLEWSDTPVMVMTLAPRGLAVLPAQQKVLEMA